MVFSFYTFNIYVFSVLRFNRLLWASRKEQVCEISKLTNSERPAAIGQCCHRGKLLMQIRGRTNSTEQFTSQILYH